MYICFLSQLVLMFTYIQCMVLLGLNLVCDSCVRRKRINVSLGRSAGSSKRGRLPAQKLEGSREK